MNNEVVNEKNQDFGVLQKANRTLLTFSGKQQHFHTMGDYVFIILSFFTLFISRAIIF